MTVAIILHEYGVRWRQAIRTTVLAVLFTAPMLILGLVVADTDLVLRFRQDYFGHSSEISDNLIGGLLLGGILGISLGLLIGLTVMLSDTWNRKAEGVGNLS